MAVNSTAGIFDDYSSFWEWFFIIHTICSCIYALIFYFCFTDAMKKNETPKNCLIISSNVISTIHSLICVVGVIIGFFMDGFYTHENHIISEPGVVAIVWIFWCSYMFTDLLAHIICYYAHPNSDIELRYDVIFHHFIAYIIVYLLDYPIPTYGWYIFTFCLITEISTIFMNFRWFAKHYEWGKDIEYGLDSAFLITWFLIRIPAILTLLIYFIYYWDVIWDIVPFRVAMSGCLIILFINALHLIWGALLINKIFRKKKHVKVNDTDSSFSSQNEKVQDGAETETLLYAV